MIKKVVFELTKFCTMTSLYFLTSNGQNNWQVVKRNDSLEIMSSLENVIWSKIIQRMVRCLVTLFCINVLHVFVTAWGEHRIIAGVLVVSDTPPRRTLVREMTVGSVARKVFIRIIGLIVNENPFVFHHQVTETMIVERQGIRELTITIGEGLVTFLPTKGNIRVTWKMAEEGTHRNRPTGSGNEKVIERRNIGKPMAHGFPEEEIKMGGIRGLLDEHRETSTCPSRGPFGIAFHRGGI